MGTVLIRNDQLSTAPNFLRLTNHPEPLSTPRTKTVSELLMAFKHAIAGFFESRLIENSYKYIRNGGSIRRGLLDTSVQK